MAMKVSYSWIIYSCLIFGSSILCDKKLEQGQAVISVSELVTLVDNNDMFYCSNGLEIQWSSVCDRYKDCSDGLDESKELCARYDYGTNISMDCGKVSSESKKEHLLEATSWIVDIYAIHEYKLGLGSIISPNVVVTAAFVFRQDAIIYNNIIIYHYLELISIGIPLQTDNENKHNFIDVNDIYRMWEPNRNHQRDVAVIVLANKISFSNGVTPICIDWYSKYKVQDGAYEKIAGFKSQAQPANHTVLQRFFPHINNLFCKYPYNNEKFSYCFMFQFGERVDDAFSYESLSFLHSNSYFLTGIVAYTKFSDVHISLPFIEIKTFIPWIRGILNKHSTANACVLPTVEGVVHSYEGSNSILSPGTLINPNTTVIENCEVGYHKAHQNGIRVCQRYGIWKTDYDKLCLKMCPPLLSESLDIKCSYYGKYANCSNRSIPDTIAIPKCKPFHVLPNGQKETPIQLHCQSNGIWNNELYLCEPSNPCVLPIVEGVVYTYDDSNEILSHGKLINLGVTINENCTFGYHNVNPNSFRVCKRNGKWKTSNDKLCLKMCPPLLSDSLDIKCSYNNKYANCSNLSIPDTIAIPKCKPAHTLPNGQKETPIQLHCQSNGIWNNELYLCEPSNPCVLPIVEGVVYTYDDSNEILSHGKLINLGVTINENCTFGYHNVNPNSFRVCKRNGKWKTSNDKLCLKMCPPLLSDSLDIKCSYNNKYANCSNLSIPDTIAIPKCKPAHTLPNGQKETPIQLHCQSNGMWNNELYICEPDCGKPFVETKTLIINGETANVGTAPWNVAIYKKKSNYEFRCSGSIISRNLVVSAAHCFWIRGMPYNITIDDGLYKIAAGKYYKNFTIYDNENAQIINVDRIHLSESYFGQPGYYADDIAVVVLQDSVSFINGILPICIDWENNYKLSNGDQGEVVGWGKTENDVESPILLKTSLPYINMTTCRDMCKDGFESYVTHDKFCAGSPLKARNIVDGGDSGAGLCFLHSKLYYLTGVVSLKEKAPNNSIALFTSVRQHITWILELYTQYKKDHYN